MFEASSYKLQACPAGFLILGLLGMEHPYPSPAPPAIGGDASTTTPGHGSGHGDAGEPPANGGDDSQPKLEDAAPPAIGGDRQWLVVLHPQDLAVKQHRQWLALHPQALTVKHHRQWLVVLHPQAFTGAAECPRG